jgi:hypothetical protein
MTAEVVLVVDQDKTELPLVAMEVGLATREQAGFVEDRVTSRLIAEITKPVLVFLE